MPPLSPTSTRRRKRSISTRFCLINPPVSLYTSAQILDDMLDDNINGGGDNIGAYIKRVVQEIAKYYKETDTISFSSEYLLYALYT